MNPTRRRLALLVGILCICLGIPPARAARPLPDPGLYLLRADQAGLLLEWIAPPVQVGIDASGRATLSAPGCAQTAQPGRLQLPFHTALIALPPGAAAQLRLLSIEETRRALPGPLRLAPRPQGVRQGPQGQSIGGEFVPAEAGNASGPAGPVTLEEIGTVRGLRLARITLYPAIVEGDQLRQVHCLQVAVTWSGREAIPPQPLDAIQRLVRGQVLNPEDAIPLPSAAVSRPALPQQQSSSSAMIEISSAGLYRLDYADLAPLGFSTANPQHLRLFRGEEEVAYEWEGDDDVAFEPGEALVFYAESRFSRWTDRDVYRLEAGTTPGLRISTRSADPVGLPNGPPWVQYLTEQNQLYTPDCFCGPLPAGRDGDHWTWQVLRRPDPDLYKASFSLSPQAVDTQQPASITLWFIGYTNLPAAPDHQVEVAFNGTTLGQVSWDGKAAVTATLDVPVGQLLPLDNTISLTLTGIPGVTVEGMWVDALALRYVRTHEASGTALNFEGQPARHAYTVGLAGTGELRAYDVSDPLQPQRLSGLVEEGSAIRLGDPPESGPHRYALFRGADLQQPAGIRAPDDPWTIEPGGAPEGADLLIITHPDFAAAIGPLATLRRSQGYTVAIANVLGIYDSSGDGRPDPLAIHAFLLQAYSNWNPPPTYVLLVGDGSFDPKGYRPDSPPTMIPPYLASVDPWAGETAADNRYACVDGADALPDMLLGRLPVQSFEEAQVVVDKLLDYEVDPFPGGWNARVVLVADDTDAAGDFAASSENQAAAYVEEPFYAARHYCTGPSNWQSDCPSGEAAAIHDALMADWNRGALLLQFIGHSSWHQWAVEKFLHLDDLTGLYNEDRLPVVLEMTCFTGAFHRPEATLDESMLTLPGGGAVAAWGPTGLGVSTGHDQLIEGFFQAALITRVETLGESTMAGTLHLAAGGQHLDLLDTFTLLGDPALRLNRTLEPWPFEAFLPLVRLNSPNPTAAPSRRQ